MIPIERDPDGNIMEVDGDSVCASTAGAPADLTPVLSSATTVRFVYVYDSKKNRCIPKRSMLKNRNTGLTREI